MSQNSEIQILSKILDLINKAKYEDEDGFAVALSRVFLENKELNPYLKEAEKIKTSFFRRNKIKKNTFLIDVHSKLLKIKMSDIQSKYPRQIFIDEIDSFLQIKDVKSTSIKFLDVLEKDVKKAILELAGEPYSHKDSGVENSDVFTSRIKFKGKRIQAAIALNGRGKFKTKKKEGIYVIADSGKNGDQINRLFEESAKLFILQCVGKFDNRVYSDMHSHAYEKSRGGKEEIYYCLIDGNDTDRIMRALKVI